MLRFHGPEERRPPAHDGLVDVDGDRAHERAQQRKAEGQLRASSLVGLDADEAARRATERGFEARVASHSVEAVTADLNGNRSDAPWTRTATSSERTRDEATGHVTSMP